MGYGAAELCLAVDHSPVLSAPEDSSSLLLGGASSLFVQLALSWLRMRSCKCTVLSPRCAAHGTVPTAMLQQLPEGRAAICAHQVLRSEQPSCTVAGVCKVHAGFGLGPGF